MGRLGRCSGGSAIAGQVGVGEPAGFPHGGICHGNPI